MTSTTSPSRRSRAVRPAPARSGSGCPRCALRELLLAALTGLATVAVRVPAAFVEFHQNKRIPFAATILDISRGGMCLHANALIPNNTLLEITAADNGTSYIVQIRWAKPLASDSYILGGSFVSPPEPQEFKAISPELCAAAKD